MRFQTDSKTVWLGSLSIRIRRSWSLDLPGFSEEDCRKMEESSVCDFVIAIDAATDEYLASLQSSRKA
jgi:hypothetical protein